MKEPRKLYGKNRQLLEGIVEDSACKVMTEYETGKGFVYAKITFSGKAAALPSTSNSKSILSIGPKNNKRPIITNSPEHQARLQAMTFLYETEMREREALKFDGNVQIFVFLGRRKVSFDSHNFSKTVGDWLEAVGVLENDRFAEIHCYKKTDYAQFIGSLDTTEIHITKKEKLRELMNVVINEVAA